MSYKSRFFVIAFLFVVVSAIVYAATVPIGSISGTFSVGSSGGAVYSIAIVSPPGSAGMSPSVSLVYNKQIKNDLVGVGWSIDGLSIIQRCAKTIALDGTKGGVNHDSNDRFCLDDMRLIAITGTYGANGTEYRTENESFSKIKSYGTAGTGPAYFKVWSRDGTVSEYGNTTDSRIEAQGKTTVRLWALNKVQDPKANYYTVTYAEDNTNGEYRPTQIDYTGIGTQAPYNSIRFHYSARTDIVPTYEAGSQIKVTQRLSNVQTYTDTTLVRSYNLTYDNNAAANRSRLISIQECGSDSVCFPATTFGWQASGQVSFTDKSNHPLPNGWNLGAPGTNGYVTGDYNGDGKGDYLIVYGNDQYVFLSNGDGTFSGSVSIYPNGWNFPVGYYTTLTGDYNGDGKGDYLIVYGNDQYVFLSNGDGTFSGSASIYPNGWNFPIGYYRTVTGDFNGDGKGDYIITWGNDQYVFLSNGDGIRDKAG